MVKFEVSKIYANSPLIGEYGTSYIRITRRTDSRIWFEHLTIDGRSYEMQDKFNVIKKESYCDSESIYLGFFDGYYQAKNEVADFETLSAEYIKKESARIAREQEKKEKRLLENVAELGEWLKEKNISVYLVEEVLQKFYNKYEEIERLKAVKNG